MGNVNHLYCVFRGAYEDTELMNESWQFGIRLMPGVTAVENIGAPPMEFDTSTDTLAGDTTNWSSTSNFLLEGGITDINPAEYLTDVGEAAKVWFEATNSYISTALELTEIVLYPMDSTGHVVNQDVGPAKAVATPKAAVDGANAGALLPLQIAQVISLRTENTTRRGRGRVYIPGMASTTLTATNGTVNASFRSNMLGTFNTLLVAMSMGNGGDPPIIRPCVIGSPYTTYYVITETRAGNLLDTQRRRRRQIEETYSSAAVSY